MDRKLAGHNIDNSNETDKTARSIVIAGYYGFENAGDELILSALTGGIKEINKTIKMTVLSATPKKTELFYDVKAVNRWNPLKVLKAIAGADLLVFGGGGLLQDITSTASILYYYSLIVIAEIFNKKVFMLAQGIGPIVKKSNKRRARRILSWVDRITVRDEESAQILQQYKIKGLNLTTTADLVLSLKARKEIYKGRKKQTFVAGLVLRERENYKNLENKIENVCRLLRDGYDTEFVVIPFHKKNDMEVSKRMAKTLGNCEVYKWRKADEIFNIYNRVEIVIGMRLHSLILACIFDKPFVAIQFENNVPDFDPKIVNFIKSLGLEPEKYALNFNENDLTDIARDIHNIYVNGKEFSSLIASGLKRLIDKSELNIMCLKDFF
jgi:polysaccharide pyruvyl transferase CsaB